MTVDERLDRLDRTLEFVATPQRTNEEHEQREDLEDQRPS